MLNTIIQYFADNYAANTAAADPVLLGWIPAVMAATMAYGAYRNSQAGNKPTKSWRDISPQHQQLLDQSLGWMEQAYGPSAWMPSFSDYKQYGRSGKPQEAQTNHFAGGQPQRQQPMANAEAMTSAPYPSGAPAGGQMPGGPAGNIGPGNISGAFEGLGGMNSFQNMPQQIQSPFEGMGSAPQNIPVPSGQIGQQIPQQGGGGGGFMQSPFMQNVMSVGGMFPGGGGGQGGAWFGNEAAY